MKLSLRFQKMIQFYFMIMASLFCTFNSESAFSHDNTCGDFLSEGNNVRYVQFGRPKDRPSLPLRDVVDAEVISFNPHKNVNQVALEPAITIQQTSFLYNLVPTLVDVRLYLLQNRDEYKNLYTSFHVSYVGWIEALGYWQQNHPEVYEEVLDFFILFHRIYISKEFNEILISRGTARIPISDDQLSMLSYHLNGRTFVNPLNGLSLYEFISDSIEYISSFY